MLASIRRLTHSFIPATQGNVAIIFGFSLIPMIGLVGLGVDYGIALTDKAKLDNAADAAAIAAVATAKAYVAANQSDQNLTSDSLAAGLSAASRAFTVNAGAVPFSTTPVPQTFTSAAPTSNTCASGNACIYLTQTGQTFTSTVFYATSTQNHFGQIFGTKVMNVKGTSASLAQIPSYLDFYLLIDVSGSMGLPATTAGSTSLIGQNTTSPDPFSGTSQGCEFACHYPGYHGWTIATQPPGANSNIQLRTGAVNTAVCNLLTLAAQPLVPNQYRVGLYPFITQMATLSPLSTNFNTLNTSATCPSAIPAPQYPLTEFNNLLDTGTTQLGNGSDPSTGTGSGGTHFDSVLPAVQTIVTQNEGGNAPYGTGATSSLPKPFIFLITDGMQNGQHYGTNQGGTWYYPGSPSSYKGFNNANFDGSSPQAINQNLCTSLKNNGATISILYIPYLPVPVAPASQYPDPYGEDHAADNQIGSLPNALSNCASTGYFYTANTPADINTALANMFNQAVAQAHLTQ